MKIALVIILALPTLALAGCRSGADSAKATQAAFDRLHRKMQADNDSLQVRDDELKIEAAQLQHRKYKDLEATLEADRAKLAEDERLVRLDEHAEEAEAH